MKIHFLLFLFLSFYNCFSQDNKGVHSNAIRQVIDLYKEKQIVALGENHGRKNESKFRLQLISDPDFGRIVDVIVVEFANPLYQKTIDDYLNGKDVNKTELKKVWQNTTQVGGVWDSPVYEQFFTMVRKVNRKLKNDNKIRVIAADPPIDWSKVNSFKDFEPFSNRGRYPIAVIEREVYAKDLKALLIFGSIHTELWGIGFTAELEKKHPNTLTVIMPPAWNETEMNFLKRYIPLESKFKLIDLEKNELGNVIYNDLHHYGRFKGKLKKAGHFMLFLGFEKDNVVHASKAVKEDIIYQKERKRRFMILARN